MKTDNQPKHTQGEWIVGIQKKELSESQTINVIKSGIIKIFVADESYPESEKTIGLFGHTSQEEAQANAQRIVKAVNMHDELIETLKMANRLLRVKCGDLFHEWPESQEIERILKQADSK